MSRAESSSFTGVSWVLLHGCMLLEVTHTICLFAAMTQANHHPHANMTEFPTIFPSQRLPQHLCFLSFSMFLYFDQCNFTGVLSIVTTNLKILSINIVKSRQTLTYDLLFPLFVFITAVLMLYTLDNSLSLWIIRNSSGMVHIPLPQKPLKAPACRGRAIVYFYSLRNSHLCKCWETILLYMLHSFTSMACSMLKI